jgi:hypothetical protein
MHYNPTNYTQENFYIYTNVGTKIHEKNNYALKN